LSLLNTQTSKLRPPATVAIWSTLWPILAAVSLGLLANFAIGPYIGGYAATILLQIGINIILAVSLTVVNGFTGQFSMGHAAFMVLGGYVAAGIVYYGSIRLFGSADFVGGRLSYTGIDTYDGPLIGKGDFLFVAATIAGGLFAAGAGYVVGLPSLRLRGDYLAIVTLGFGEIVRVLLQGTRDQYQFSTLDEAKNAPIWEIPLHMGGAHGFSIFPTYATLFWVWMWVVVTLVFIFRVKASSTGRAFLSIREDEIAAQAMGINITRQKVRAFTLASFFAGVAGALSAMYVGAINATDAGFQRSFDFIIMVVLGGLGSISGAVLAAIILTILPEALRDLAQYRLIIYALLLIIMMILRPQGLFGLKEIWDLRWARRLLGKSSKGGAA